jgi:SAM-dependent methyltransferase
MPCVDFEFDADAVASAYRTNAPGYAATYADHLETNPFDRAVLSRLLATVRADGLVLDAGCGPAQAAAFAEARGLRAVGLDLTREMLLEARSRTAGPLVQGDLRALPFAARTFDAVIAWFSLLHLPMSAMPAALADIRRLMRPGAPLVVALHGARFGESLEWSAYTVDELATLLRAAGFTDVVGRTRPPAPGENPVTKVIVSGLR